MALLCRRHIDIFGSPFSDIDFHKNIKEIIHLLKKTKKTRYDYNLMIMKSPKPATHNRFKKIIKSYL